VWSDISGRNLLEGYYEGDYWIIFQQLLLAFILATGMISLQGSYSFKHLLTGNNSEL